MNFVKGHLVVVRENAEALFGRTTSSLFKTLQARGVMSVESSHINAVSGAEYIKLVGFAGSYNAEFFKLWSGSEAPRPPAFPAHFNCRTIGSTTVKPVLPDVLRTLEKRPHSRKTDVRKKNPLDIRTPK